MTTVSTSAQGRKYAKLTSVGKATGGAYKIPAGIVVHVTEVPGQQIITADGVKVEVKAANQPNRSMKDAAVTVDD